MARETIRRRAPAQAAPARPSRLRLWLKRHRGLARPAAVAVLAAGVVGAAGYGVMSAGVRPQHGAPERRDASSTFGDGIAGLGAKAGLTVREIDMVLEGGGNTPPALLRTALSAQRGDPMLAFSPQQARERLESIPWVESAHVERRLPGTIRVVVKEREPFALWQRDKRFSVIDAGGRVLTTENAHRFAGLPLVVGAGAEQGAAPMIEVLRGSAEVEQRVQALVRVGERRWDLKLRNGTDVMLPEGHEAAAVARLAELQASKSLLDRPLAAIDMRQPDKLVLRPPAPAPGAQPAEAAVPPPQRPRSGGRG